MVKKSFKRPHSSKILMDAIRVMLLKEEEEKEKLQTEKSIPICLGLGLLLNKAFQNM